jgi:hypothetical protein
MQISLINKESSAQKLSDHFEAALLAFGQILKEAGLVLRSLLVAFLALDDVAHVEPALAALALAAQAVLVEGVTAHEVDRGEGQSVLAVRAVVRQERLRSRLQLLELQPALLTLLYVFAHDLLVPLDVHAVLFQSESQVTYFCRKKLLMY